MVQPPPASTSYEHVPHLIVRVSYRLDDDDDGDALIRAISSERNNAQGVIEVGLGILSFCYRSIWPNAYCYCDYHLIYSVYCSWQPGFG